MKKQLLASLALALAFTVPAYADTNLVFAFWGDPPEVPPFQKIVDDYQAKHPDVHIEMQNAPWSGYFTRLDAQLAAVRCSRAHRMAERAARLRRALIPDAHRRRLRDAPAPLALGGWRLHDRRDCGTSPQPARRDGPDIGSPAP